MSTEYDDAVVGAGIMGLAVAYNLAKRGRKVIVFERNRWAMGASVRNFGMLWPIGQPKGLPFDIAMQSRSIWLDVLRTAGIWHDPCGSYHLSYNPLETQVMAEFLQTADGGEYSCQWHNPAQILSRSPNINPDGLEGALFSGTEVCIDPREVISLLPDFLKKNYDVDFAFNSAVTSYERPYVTAAGKAFRARNLFVCSGDDFQTLYPDHFAASGLYRVKLQMMRTKKYGETVRLGPMLAAGLTLCHYKNFKDCPTLPELREHFKKAFPELVKYGIHVMASQYAGGEITIGDSHEYDDQIQPFDKEEINQLILGYLKRFLSLPELTLIERWNGVYAAHTDELCWTATPDTGVRIIASPSGRGMTMSFGITEREIATHLEE